MFKFLQKLFKKDSPQKSETQQLNEKRKSSVIYQNKNRLLKIKNSECGLIFHENNEVEVVFTALYNETQQFTPEEELLMALTIFLKQPGFGDMLMHEFHRIANKHSQMFEDDNNNKEKDKK